MEVQERIERAIELDPELRQLRSQLRFDLTREGLRIQVLDTEQRPMFELGSDQVAPTCATFYGPLRRCSMSCPTT